MNISIQKLSKNAVLPTQNSVYDAGYDLYAAEYGSTPPLSRLLVKTDIAVAIPEGFYGRVAPRSGLAYKNGIDVLAGVIDATYRGNIGVILYNTSKETHFEFKAGDRIAQLIIEKCYIAEWEEVLVLEPSVRGQKGFGSSGA
jgi:dUTP pyrophosphatase